ncbi:glycosyl transferase family protein [Achlya hypogyna]|uniref:Glycosyl transferase family protein n=1 Tax=Achlya hypogyna TaxID=1202772 RepID=A0A1V9Z919_ACHHY|nr:glycosyl transferase family protein [Achlya hypogyna]
MERRAFATLVTTDVYAVGARVLRASLLSSGSTYPLVIMYTPAVSSTTVAALGTIPHAILRLVSPIAPRPTQIVRYAFDRFQDAWSKLRVFELEDFDTVVFLDADMLCVGGMNDLFDQISPDPRSLVASLACTCNPAQLPHYPKTWTPATCAYSGGEQRYFNSGMMVVHPNKTTLAWLVDRLQAEDDLSRFFFSDQCFLNEAFPNFTIASYCFNALKTLRTAHPALWRPQEIKCIHFILEKPWAVDMAGNLAMRDPYYDLYMLWWAQAGEVSLPAAA